MAIWFNIMKFRRYLHDARFHLLAWMIKFWWHTRRNINFHKNSLLLVKRQQTNDKVHRGNGNEIAIFAFRFTILPADWPLICCITRPWLAQLASWLIESETRAIKPSTEFHDLTPPPVYPVPKSISFQPRPLRKLIPPLNHPSPCWVAGFSITRYIFSLYRGSNELATRSNIARDTTDSGALISSVSNEDCIPLESR